MEVSTQIINKNAGLNQFMKRVFYNSGVQLSVSIGTAYFVSRFQYFKQKPLLTLGLGTLALLGGVIGVKLIKPIYQHENKDGEIIVKTKNTKKRIFFYTMGTIGLGVTGGSIFTLAEQISTNIIPAALFTTSFISAGTLYSAFTLKREQVFSYKNAFKGCIYGLIGIQAISLISYLIYGRNDLSDILSSIENILGIGVFSLYNIYDTHVAITQFENGNADHMGVSLEFVLNFWNILIRVIDLMITISGNKKRKR